MRSVQGTGHLIAKLVEEGGSFMRDRGDNLLCGMVVGPLE